jgi:hypothetical protein
VRKATYEARRHDVAYAVDDALSRRDPADMPTNPRYVTFVEVSFGGEDVLCAVWSYLDAPVYAREAKQLTRDLMEELAAQWDDPIPFEIGRVLR